MSDKPQPAPKPRPLIAIGITGVVCGLAIQDQLSSGSVDSETLGALIVLCAFWMGRGLDEVFRR